MRIHVARCDVQRWYKTTKRVHLVGGSLHSPCVGLPHFHFSPATAPYASHSVNYLWQTTRKCFLSSIITDFCPFSFTEQEMDKWELCLSNLHPQSPSLSGSCLIHAVTPKHNTLSHWASLTVETCTDSVALSSHLQETNRQTACWEKKKQKTVGHYYDPNTGCEWNCSLN